MIAQSARAEIPFLDAQRASCISRTSSPNAPRSVRNLLERSMSYFHGLSETMQCLARSATRAIEASVCAANARKRRQRHGTWVHGVTAQVLLRVTAVVIWAGVGGCTYLLDLEPNQCKVDADCLSRPGFEGTSCVAGSCKTSLSAAGSTQGPPKDGCTSNTKCVADHNNQPYACIEPGQDCVPLTTEECPVVFGNYNDDNALYFGALLNVPSNAPLSQQSTLNVQLAVDEFNGSVGGLPGGPLGKLRPLVGVVCRNEPELVPAESSHLFDRIGVAATIAHLPSGELKSFLVDRALPKQAFVMNPGFADNSLTSLSSQGLFWHVIGDIRDVAPAYPPLVARLEKMIKAGGSDEPLRVAMLVSRRYAEQSIADTLAAQLEFNGNSAAENGSAFYTAAVPVLADEPSADYTSVVDALLKFRPNVVIAITREELVYKILPDVEERWPRDQLVRPYYILPNALSGNQNLLDYVAYDSRAVSSENKRQRMVGVAPASAEDLQLYNQFLLRFRAAYPTFPNPGGFENFYDAVYLVANAMYAAGSVPRLTGPDVARGMQRVIAGPIVVNAGPTFIADGFSALAAGGNIRLNGTMGLADFDPGVGARRGNGSIYCIQRRGSQLGFVYDVLRYDKSSKTLKGEFPCFPGL
ncbi:MAG TPA: hypothetical protein VFQ61_18425 [Polyangiaceae bacterium]|nr:hypothetical protein [Polyangiaceae bacterium]